MRTRYVTSAATLAFALFLAMAGATATTGGNSGSKDSSAPAASSASSTQDEDLRLEGEKRFRANCARCHAAPPKFAPRMMGTIVRHMRVRANITNDDMRLVLRYMTQ